MATDNKAKTASDKARLKEILAILNKHSIQKGLNPEKLRHILEDLGPTFVKLGQIMSMRNDMIPADFATELTKLRAEVAPMPIEEVHQVIESSCQGSLSKIFSDFEETPLGSGSIAQAHRATLPDGNQVVVKVQRIGVYEVMARDISLLRYASVIMKIAGGIEDFVDFDQVLDELWNVSQEETNFLIEAENAEEFRNLNQDIAYIGCPLIYRNLSTSKVLVMEYIGGFVINDLEALDRNGYDRNEIGMKLANNYVKQIIEDGFFHADPHPANIKIRDGKIVWIDLGMMGRISSRDQKLIRTAITAVAKHDIASIKDAVLALGESHGRLNHSKLYNDIDTMLNKYVSLDLGNINMAKMIEEIINVAKSNQIAMPASITMLARGIATIEGVLAQISPKINLLEISANQLTSNLLAGYDWQKVLTTSVGNLMDSGQKALRIPSLAFDLLNMTLKGESKLNMELHTSSDFERGLDRIASKIIVGLLVAALLVGSSLICTTDMKPKILNIPAMGALGYLIAVILTGWLFYDSWIKR